MKTFLPYNKSLKSNAQNLRKTMTDAESLLWSRVRQKQVWGIQFYRQKTIENYIVDFYAPSAKLVIELDGGQHYEEVHMKQDEKRDAHLRSLNLIVLRFDNLQVLQETEAVMEFIFKEIQKKLNPPLASLAAPFKEKGAHINSPSVRQRSALITGAARRIGRAMALHLAKQGWHIGIHYHQSVNEARTLQQEIEGLGRRTFLMQADLSKEEQVRTIIPRTTESLGTLDLLINNASIFTYDSVTSADRSSWDDHLEPNLRAPFALMQDFAKTTQDKGLIINMIDQRVWHLTPHFVSYTVSKFGLWGLTQSLALALAPRIRVNAIGPGPILQNIRQTLEEFDAQCRSMPLGIGGSLEDICAAVDFFWHAKSVTGQMIAIDGGQHLGGGIVTKRLED